jgi:hypothetical protein
MKKRFSIKDIIEKPEGFLEDWEVRVVSFQVRKNSELINRFILAIDLLANKEKCPKDTNLLAVLRKKLSIATEENDTFRRVLWRHMQAVESRIVRNESEVGAASFLIGQIRTRYRAMIANISRK